MFFDQPSFNGKRQPTPDKDLPQLQDREEELPDRSSLQDPTIDLSLESKPLKQGGFDNLANQSDLNISLKQFNFTTPQNQGVVSFAYDPADVFPDDEQCAVIATEEDFTFIQEVIHQAGVDLRQKEILPQTLVELSQLEPIELESSLVLFAQEISAQFGEYHRVLEFSGFLLDQARLAQKETEETTYKLEQSRREVTDLQQRENCIMDDWRQEQNSTRQLESEVKRKDEQLGKVQAQYNRQRLLMDSLYREKDQFELTIQEHKSSQLQLARDNSLIKKTVKGLSGASVKTQMDFSFESRIRIEELEQMVLQKVEELDEAIEKMETQNFKIAEMNQLNVEINADLEETQLIIEEYEDRIRQLEVQNNSQIIEVTRLQNLSSQQTPMDKIAAQLNVQGLLSVDDTASYHSGLNTTSQNQYAREYDFGRAASEDRHNTANFALSLPARKSSLTPLEPQTTSPLQILADQARQQNRKVPPQIRISEVSIDVQLQIQDGPSTTRAGDEPVNIFRPSENYQDFQEEEDNQSQDNFQAMDQSQEMQQFSDQQSHEMQFQEQHSIDSRMDDHFQNLQEHTGDIRINDQQDYPVQIEDVNECDDNVQQQPHLMNTNLTDQTFDQLRITQLDSGRRRATEKPTENLFLRMSQISTTMTQRLKERQAQLKHFIQNVDQTPPRLQQSDVDTLRSTFTIASKPSKLDDIKGYQPLSPMQTKKKFDFSEIAQQAPSTTVNNTYYVNNFNNCTPSPTQPQVTATPIVYLGFKPVELVDLDNYRPTISRHTTVQSFVQIPAELKLSFKSQRDESEYKPRDESEYKPRDQSEFKPRDQSEFKPVMEIIVEEQPYKIRDTQATLQSMKKSGLIESIKRSFMLNIESSPPTSPTAAHNTSTSTARRRALGERKKPEEEFFSMTLVAQIMSHPQKNLIIALITDSHKLFKLCQTENKLFFEWPEWISTYLRQEMQRIKILAAVRASKLVQPPKLI